MLKTMKKLLYSIIVLLFSVTVFAQPPQSFNYQAVARDALGEVIANQQVNFQLSIIEGSASGTAIYIEQHTDTTNQFGLVNLVIGNGSVLLGDFISVDWSNNNYFLKIELNGVHIGTSQLLSVPYALHAKTVENMDDADADSTNEIQDLQLSGNDLSITNKLNPTVIGLSHYLDNTDAQDLSLSGNTLSLTNDATSVDLSDLLDNSGSWSKTGSNIYYIDGNVGIGTTEPDNKLFVEGSAVITDYLAVGPVGDDIFLVQISPCKVGIGTSTPSSKLSVNGIIESMTGGIKFPDGSTQTTATTDFSPTNEFQTLSITGNDLTISSGNTVVLPSHIVVDTSEFLFIDFVNLFAGYNSGVQNTTGNYNVFLGVESGHANTIGNNNVFIGDSAGYSNIDGIRSVYVGASSGRYSTDADYNAFFGSFTGFQNTTGNRNTFIGNEAGYNNTTGNYNVYAGRLAGYTNSTGDNNVFIGNEAGRYYTGSNKLFIENSSAGSSNALIYGDFDSDQLSLNASVGIGYGPYDSYSLVVKGGTVNSLRVYEDIGQTYAFYVSGDAYATGSWYTPSDQNLKTNIHTYQNAVEDLLKIRGVKFNWNIDEKSDVTYPKGDQFGVIAQEVEKIFPELVKKDSEGKLAVAYSGFTPILIEAIKEQQRMINELKQEIEKLKNR